KTTIVLIVLLAGMGIYLLFARTAGEAPAGSKAENKLLAIESADVTKVAIHPADGKPTVLEKSGTDWRLVEPVNAPADTFQVDDLLRELTELKSRGQVEADQKAAAGLDHPSYTVELTAKDGKL